MPRFRVTVRHGPPHQYEIRDIDAPTLADALRLAVERIEVLATPGADLVEVRVMERD
jgi:hypothetical protein